MMGARLALAAMVGSLAWYAGDAFGLLWGLIAAVIFVLACWAVSLFLLAVTLSTRVVAVGQWLLYAVSIGCAVLVQRAVAAGTPA